ncbi:dihydrofolate reductase [Patescibacteria group bacterium]|nr:dihydrofolate reductase [Patescibacteria group bacterium]
MAQKKPLVSAIAAITEKDRGIGKDNDLLWKIPADLKRFKEITFAHPIIMGRKNFESIGRALPGRMNIIVTRDTAYRRENCVIAHSIEDAMARASALDDEEVFIIGGGEIYTQALPFTDRLYLTLIHAEKPADVFFPEYSEFTKVISEEKGEHEGTRYTFLTLDR